MRYLFYLIFLIGSYIFPFVACYNLIIWLEKNEPPSLGGALLIYLLYIILYILRFITFIFIALISFCFKNYFMRLYKYNFLIILLLFIVDIILYNALDSIFGRDFYETMGFWWAIVFLSLSSTYFPFWLVFGIRNAICFVKELKNKKSE